MIGGEVQADSIYPLLAGLFSALSVGVIALGVALARTREKVSSLEARVANIEKRVNHAESH